MRLNYPVSRPVTNNNILVLSRMHTPYSHQTYSPLTIIKAIPRHLHGPRRKPTSSPPLQPLAPHAAPTHLPRNPKQRPRRKRNPNRSRMRRLHTRRLRRLQARTPPRPRPRWLNRQSPLDAVARKPSGSYCYVYGEVS
jgi:hypothetical protein